MNNSVVGSVSSFINLFVAINLTVRKRKRVASRVLSLNVGRAKKTQKIRWCKEEGGGCGGPEYRAFLRG